MRQMTFEEVKAAQLQILDFVAAFCEQNGINYWIDCGTLLGAIRHKGYIPWDDDVDIGMLREDYDKFSEIFNQKADSRFRFVCIENTPDFHLSHGKVCDSSTVLYEPDENGNKLAVSIDVFVYDNAPDDEAELNRMFDLRDKYLRISRIKAGDVPKSDSAFKNLLKVCRQLVYKLVYPNIGVKDIIENSKKYANEELTRVGNFASYTRLVCEKDAFESFIKVEFEGRKFNAPVGYDKWLRSFYGDYMQLPPPEKRVLPHTYKAFYKDENQ